jgi:uncharacterized metal-binding protein
MAQYNTHIKFNILVAMPFLIWICVRFVTYNYIYAYIFTTSFVYATFFMNPDLDLANNIKLFSIRGILTLPFRFYSMIFTHRGISHSPIWGTLTRIIWLGMIGVVVLILIDKTFFTKKDITDFFSTYGMHILFGLGGLLSADICHLILDFIYSIMKR